MTLSGFKITSELMEDPRCSKLLSFKTVCLFWENLQCVFIASPSSSCTRRIHSRGKLDVPYTDRNSVPLQTFASQRRILSGNREAFCSKLVYKSILYVVYHALNAKGLSQTIVVRLIGFLANLGFPQIFLVQPSFK